MGFIPGTAGPRRRAAGRSSSRTWGARPGSTASSAAAPRGYRTSLRRRLRHGCLQSEEDRRHSCGQITR